MMSIKPKTSRGATPKFLIPIQKAASSAQGISKFVNINYVAEIDADRNKIVFTMQDGNVISAKNDADIWHALYPFIGINPSNN